MAAYRAWGERPRQDRLGTYLMIPNPEAERFVRWRLAVLTEGATP